MDGAATRPTPRELSDANKAVLDMVAAKIGGREVKRTKAATIACAIALHAGERFASDKAAKRAFGVCVTTNLRKRWLPCLHALARWRRNRDAEIIDADDESAELLRPEPFMCRHEPSCKNAVEHKALCETNTALRRERQRLRAVRRPPRRAPRPEIAPLPPQSPQPPQQPLRERGKRCEGITRLDEPCKVDASHGMDAAEPLKTGGRFCAHHHPDKFTGTQCKGITKQHVRCRVFSGSLYHAAEPLRDGEELCGCHRVQAAARVYCAGLTRGGKGARCRISSWAPFPDAAPLRHGKRFCTMHAYQSRAFVRCAGVTLRGERCGVTSWHDNAGALPLRDGGEYCERHAEQGACAAQPDPAVPDGTTCASCGGTRGLGKDPSDPDTWYCQRCWDEWQRTDPLAAVWTTMFGSVLYA